MNNTSIWLRPQAALSNAAHIDQAIRDAEAAYTMLDENQLALAKCIEAHTVAANAYSVAGDEDNRQKQLSLAGELVATIPDDAIDQLLFHAACYWDRKGDWDQALNA